MKKILVMFLVVVGFVFVVNSVLVAAPTGRTEFEAIDGPVVDATYKGDMGWSGAVRGIADSTSMGAFTYGVYGVSQSSGGVGVYGYAPAATGSTIGVWGKSDSPRGYGVKGEGYWGVGGHGTDYGVYGYSSEGWAIYACGKAAVSLDLEVGTDLEVLGDATVGRNLTVTGQLNITGAIPTYTNLAQPSTGATITADSYYNGNYSAEKARDGIFNRWDEGEQASAGKGFAYYRDLTQARIDDSDPLNDRAWLQLDWPAPQDINEIKIYDRPNRNDKILDAWLLVRRSDGSTTELHLGMFPYGGAPKVINLTSAEGTGVTSIKLTITEVGPDTLNVGVSEIECFRDRSIW